MVATAGSRGIGAEVGREERGDGRRVEADSSAPAGFERCKVGTSSAASVAASWYWCTVASCGLEVLAVPRAEGAAGHSSPCHGGVSMPPAFPLG